MVYMARPPSDSAVEEIVYKIFPNDLNRYAERKVSMMGLLSTSR